MVTSKRGKKLLFKINKLFVGHGFEDIGGVLSFLCAAFVTTFRPEQRANIYEALLQDIASDLHAIEQGTKTLKERA